MAGNQSGIPISSTSVLNHSQFIQPQNQLVSIRLNENNYLIWKQQVLTAIKGYGLEKFLSNEGFLPEEFIVDDQSQQQIQNPEFLAWQRQDQLVASWILSSLSENILVMMVGLTTSKDIWESLETSFASQSRARLMQYKLQLQTIKKGSQCMREYLNKVKSCCDVLASAGQRISEDDQILHILSGLGNEYDHVMVSITSRAEPCSLKEVHAMLLTFESRLEPLLSTVVNIDGSTPAANTVTQVSSQRRTNASDYQTNRRRNQSFNQGFRGRRGRSYFRGRGGRDNKFNNRPQCHVCHIFGHTADRCFYRFDTTYGGPANTPTGANTNPAASTNHMVAMVLSPETGNEAAWFADSGASNHVTNELANLNLASEFQGNNRLQVGNGTGLMISHIGNSHFKNSASFPRSFILKNLLHVPILPRI